MAIDMGSDAPPLYRQIKDDIRRRILSGKWPHGSRIPSEKVLSDEYEMSLITVRKALDELRQEGYLERKQGKGTYVSPVTIEQKLSRFYSFSEVLREKGIQEYAKLLNFEAIPANVKIASKLDLIPGDQVFCIERIRYADKTPYTVEQSFIPCRIASELTGERVQQLGLYSSLGSLGVYMDRATEHLRAVNLPEHTAKTLEVESGAAAILLERITYSGYTKAEYCFGSVRGDFFSYTVELK